jgi:hypothetical protein
MSAIERAKQELRRVVLSSPRIGRAEYVDPDPYNCQQMKPEEAYAVFLLSRLTMVYVASHTLRNIHITKEDLEKPLKPRGTPVRDLPKGDLFYHCLRCVAQAVDHDRARLMAAPTDLAEQVLADATLTYTAWKANAIRSCNTVQ